MSNLDVHGPTPLYIQLADWIRTQISDGVFTPGVAIPSEPDLVERYQVSRTTVRQALNLLAEEDIIIKVQGKGTFVRQPEVTQDLVSLQTINEVLTNAGLMPTVEVLSVETLSVVPPIAKEELQVAADQTVVRVKRLHRVEKHPVAYAEIYLSGHFEWRFSIDDLKEKSIYSWLEEQSQIEVHSGRQVIRATAANNEVSALLELPLGSPILYVENTSHTIQQTPIDFTQFYFPPDLYSLEIGLQRTTKGISVARVQADVES